jgi:hypothetical protein
MKKTDVMIIGLLLWQWDCDDYRPDQEMMWLVKTMIRLPFML